MVSFVAISQVFFMLTINSFNIESYITEPVLTVPTIISNGTVYLQKSKIELPLRNPSCLLVAQMIKKMFGSYCLPDCMLATEFLNNLHILF